MNAISKNATCIRIWNATFIMIKNASCIKIWNATCIRIKIENHIMIKNATCNMIKNTTCVMIKNAYKGAGVSSKPRAPWCSGQAVNPALLGPRPGQLQASDSPGRPLPQGRSFGCSAQSSNIYVKKRKTFYPPHLTTRLKNSEILKDLITIKLTF